MGNIRGAIAPRDFPEADIFPGLLLDACTTGRSRTLPLNSTTLGDGRPTADVPRRTPATRIAGMGALFVSFAPYVRRSVAEP
jgi:hypothetical protein